MDREERIEEYYHNGTRELAEWVVDLEDEVALLKKNQAYLIRVNESLSPNELDPSRLESALRMYIGELDYDVHKELGGFNEEGVDMYPQEVEFFLRCWETAGEGN